MVLLDREDNVGRDRTRAVEGCRAPLLVGTVGSGMIEPITCAIC